MTISYIGANVGQTNASVATFSISKNGSLAEKDLMLTLVGTIGADADMVTIPSGYQEVGRKYADGALFYLFWKIATASEPSSYAWEVPYLALKRGVNLVYRGDYDLTNPIATFSNVLYATGNTTVRAAGITVPVDNSDCLALGQQYSSSSTSFTRSGWTEDYDSGSTTYRFWECAYYNVLNAGATGNIDITASTSATSKHAFLLALNKATAAASPSLFFGRQFF